MWKAVVAGPYGPQGGTNTLWAKTQEAYLNQLIRLAQMGVGYQSTNLQLDTDMIDLDKNGYNEGAGVIDEDYATPATFCDAVENHPVSGDDLVIYLFGQISANGLKFGDSSYLTPAALGAAIDQCAAAHVLIVVDGSYSGQFLSVATGRPNVVVITATTDSAYVSSVSNVSQTFGGYFIGKCVEGDNVNSAFNKARQYGINMGTFNAQLAGDTTLAASMQIQGVGDSLVP